MTYNKNVFYDSISNSTIHLSEKLEPINTADILLNLKFGDFVFHNFYSYIILSKTNTSYLNLKKYQQAYITISQLGNKWIDFEKTKKANPNSLRNDAFTQIFLKNICLPIEKSQI